MYEIVYDGIDEKEEYKNVIEKVLLQCFKEEKLEDSKLCVTVTLTTPKTIQEINKQYRNIDRATDVLSFPMFEKKELDKICKNREKLGSSVFPIAFHIKTQFPNSLGILISYRHVNSITLSNWQNIRLKVIGKGVSQSLCKPSN